MSAERAASSAYATRQLSTFFIEDRWYGIDVSQVQEITRPLPITALHRAPGHVIGLINLRGQIATAIGLRQLFGLPASESAERMTVVCRHEGALLSLIVDRIGDIIEVSDADFEPPPATIHESTRRFMRGVYKTSESILSVIEMNKLSQFLSK